MFDLKTIYKNSKEAFRFYCDAKERKEEAERAAIRYVAALEGGFYGDYTVEEWDLSAPGILIYNQYSQDDDYSSTLVREEDLKLSIEQVKMLREQRLEEQRAKELAEEEASKEAVREYRFNLYKELKAEFENS